MNAATYLDTFAYAHRFFARHIGHTIDTEDLASAVALRVAIHEAAVAAGGLKSYIYLACTNGLTDYYRQGGRRTIFSLEGSGKRGAGSWEEYGEILERAGMLPLKHEDYNIVDKLPDTGAVLTADAYELSEMRCAVLQAVNELPQDHREAVILHYFLEMDYESIAATRLIPIGTVRSRMARARDTLKRKLARYVEA